MVQPLCVKDYLPTERVRLNTAKLADKRLGGLRTARDGLTEHRCGAVTLVRWQTEIANNGRIGWLRFRNFENFSVAVCSFFTRTV